MSTKKAVEEATKTLNDARGEVARLEALQEDQTAKLQVLEGELAQLELHVGERALAGMEAGAGAEELAVISSEVSDKRSAIDSMIAALQSLEAKLEDARREVDLALAAALRLEAARLRKEAKRRQAKTDKLLAELEAWEGVAYVPTGSERQTAYVNPGTVGGEEVVVRTLPKTQGLLNRAKGLEMDAQALEEGKPLPRSAITGELLQPLPEMFA